MKINSHQKYIGIFFNKRYLSESAKGTILEISGNVLVQKVEFLAVYYTLKRDFILRLKKVPFCVLQKGTV